MLTIDNTGSWVDVVFLENYRADMDEYGAPDIEYIRSAEGCQAIAEYLSQWDYGTETDGAHTTDGAQWGSADDLYPVTVGGLDYIMSANTALGYVSLNRRPLD